MYQEPQVVAKSNLTGRQASLSRAIISCPVPNTKFLRSFCDPETLVPGTLQRYTVICEEQRPDHWTDAAAQLGVGNIVTTGDRPPPRPHVVQRIGFCRYDEVCIETARFTSEANCVKRAYFKAIMSTWNGAQSAMTMVDTMAEADSRSVFNSGFGGMTASVVMSDVNGTSPVAVDTFKVEAEASENASGIDEQTTKCRDCVDLETDKLKPQTDSLKTEVRLLTTGAAAGILWLAIMSG